MAYLSRSESLKALKFLKNEGRFWPNHIVAKHLGLRRTQIHGLRKRNKLKFEHSIEAMKDPVYLAWYKPNIEKQKALEFLKNEGRFWPNHIVAEHLGLRRVEINSLRQRHKLQLRHSKKAMKDPVYLAWYKSKPNNFTPFELTFIERRTIDAAPGARFSPAKLAKLPEMWRHTKESIADVIKKRGWADPQRSKYIKSGRQLTKKQKRELFKLLNGIARFWPSSIVAKHVKRLREKPIPVFQINRFRAKHHLKIVHSNEAMHDPVYRAWYELREKKRKSKLRIFFKERAYQIELSLERKLEKFLNEKKQNFQWKSCISCKHDWPFMSLFFRRKKIKSKSGNKSFELLNICLACLANPKNRN